MQNQLTILAYEMNGEPLSELHGAPLRLRNERELGFEQVKWIEAVEFVESFAALGAGQGGYNQDHEFYGYRESIEGRAAPTGRTRSAVAVVVG